MRILLTGGGTLGSVTPLLGVISTIRGLVKEPVDFFWIGTKAGPERLLIERLGIRFTAIPSGKWRRYFSWQNFIDIIRIEIGFLMAVWWLLRWRPAVVVGAGSFVSVPVGWAAYLLGIPVLIHQQDVLPSLSNKLLSAVAAKITSVWPTEAFPINKLSIIGNPVRPEFLQDNTSSDLLQELNFDPGKPIVMIVGGGTGADFINNLVDRIKNDLLKFCNVLHITGPGKLKPDANYGYATFALVGDKIYSYLRSADIVVSRAGMGFLSELGYLGKPVVIIPMPQSHQEANAAYLEVQEAAVVRPQTAWDDKLFIEQLQELLANDKLRQKLSQNIMKLFPPQANDKMVEIILQLVNKKV